MKQFLLLLALAGISLALQGDIHYQYKYYASVTSGIPELSNLASGWAIKSDVHVYVEDNTGVATFQLENVLVAEFNDKLGCDSRNEIPPEYFKPIQDGVLATAIEQQFIAHLFDDEEVSVEYIKSDYKWLPNVLKGIVSVFRNEVLRGNIDKQIEDSIASILHDGHVVEVFTVEEETMFGKCFVEYSLHRIPHHLAISKEKDLKAYIEVDDQTQILESSAYTSKTSKKTSKKYTSKSSKKTSRKTSKTAAKYAVPPALKIDETLWHVVRAVNFDRCEEVVGFVANSIEKKKNVFGGQVDWRRSRSSVTEYIFRGSPGHFRMDRAIVEGAKTFSPLAIHTEVLQGRINQTYHLVSATKIGAIPVVHPDFDEIKQSKTWMQEFWSFASHPKYSLPHPWIHYTGEGESIGRYETFGLDHIQDQDLLNIKNTIMEKIKVVSLVLTDLEQEDSDAFAGSTAEALQQVSFLFKFLPKDKILDIFDHFFDKNLHQSDVLAQKLVIDTAAASGYRGAIDSILDYIIAGKLPDLQIITVLMTLSSNVECTASLGNIMDWILTLDIKEKPFVTTTAIINFAHMISEMCVQPKARNIKYPGKLFGDHGCTSEIKEKFLPLIKKLLHDESDWVKIVGIEALASVGTPFSVGILSPIIEGKVKCSTRVRYYAIFALNPFNFFDYEQLREPIIDLLTSIYTDYGVSVPLREAALDVVSNWSPGTAFWHKIARMSWREPSKRFASFITSLIKTYAHLSDEFMKESSQSALHALNFARPTAPTHDYSELFWSVENDFQKHVKKNLGLAVYKSKSFKSLTEVFTFMMYDLGGIEVILSESFAVASDLFVGKRIFDSFEEEKPKINDIAAKVAKDFYNRVEETIKTKSTKRSPKTTLELSWTLFDHIRIFLPLNKETFSKLPYSDMTELGALLVQFTMGHDLVLGKFFIPFDFFTIHATEIGIPLFVAGSAPIVLTDVSYSSLSSESKSPGIEFVKKAELSAEFLSSGSTAFHTSLAFLLPWSKKLIQTGVKANRDFTLPFRETLKGKESNDGGHQNIIHLDIQSQYKKKFSLGKASNIPYTGIFPILPVEGATVTSFKKIINTEPRYKHIQPLPVKYTGLELDLKIGSEASLPFTLFGGEHILSPFECSDAHPFVFYFLASPTVKFWEVDLIFDPEKSTTKKITIENMLGTFGKSKPEAFTQETGDFYQYGQEGLGQYDQEGVEQFDQKPSFDFQEGFQEIGNTGKEEVETLAHVNYGDSIQQRSQKMQQYFGGLVKTFGYKFDFDGEEHRSFEVLFSLSQSKPDDLTKIKKFQLSFIRSPIPHVDDKPASVCLDVQTSIPLITSLDTFKDLLTKQLNKEFKAEVTLGCTGKPVFIAKGSYELSEAWKKKYEENLKEACDYDEQDPLYTFKHHAVYDEAKFTITWEKVCDPEHFPITTKLFGFGHNILASGLLHTSCKQNDRQIKIDVYRCPITENWFIEATRGEKSTKFENIVHDEIFNFIFGVVRKEDSDFIPSHHTPFNLESDKCIVGVDKVRTFDGFKYEYHPTQCWTVAFKDCFANDNMLLVRSPQGESTLPEARYIDLKKGLVIEFSSNTIRVNGKIVDPIGGPEIIKDENEKVTLVKIYKKNDFYKVKLDNDFYILFKDQIEIKVDWIRSGHTCGLCGDSDGEPEAELVGPHRCLFSDPNLFVSSWTAGSDTCDLYTLMELRQEVEQFQEKQCHLIEDYEDKCKERNSPCVFYEFDIVNDGKDYDVCVSSRPLPFCKTDQCQIQTFQEKTFTYFCWPQEHTPDFVKSALESNQSSTLQHYLYEPYYETTYTFNVPTSCKRY